MRTSRPAPLLALALLAGAACSHGATSEAPPSPSAAIGRLGDTLRVARGESVRVDGGRLTLTLTEVADSRCPANVVCVWAGDAAATLRLDAAGAIATPTLHTTLEPKRVVHGGYDVALLTVEPYPGTEPARPGAAPTAVLRVTRP